MQHSIDSHFTRISQQIAECRSASRSLGLLRNRERNALLQRMSVVLDEQAFMILEANQEDLIVARNKNLSDAMIDRLTLDSDGLKQMQNMLHQVCGMSDPLQKVFPLETRPNGLQVTRKAIPLGVILMIYESRPNVTVEAAALAVKSGNGIVLRGGKEAFHTNQAIAKCWRMAFNGFHQSTSNQQTAASSQLESCVVVVDVTDRELLPKLLRLDQLIDLVIPRGGESLIRTVVENSLIPVIKHDKGVCHLFVDSEADLGMALDILVNGKTQRPGVCNALEGLVIHEEVAEDFLPMVAQAFASIGVKISGCEKTCALLPGVTRAEEADFAREFLDLEITVKLVESLEQAIGFIDRFGSGHTEVIITRSDTRATEFVNRVDASVVMVNASSRFSDGGELGLGAEIGISTTKMHAYGPMGLEALTSSKFVVVGEGQTRQ